MPIVERPIAGQVGTSFRHAGCYEHRAVERTEVQEGLNQGRVFMVVLDEENQFGRQGLRLPAGIECSGGSNFCPGGDIPTLLSLCVRRHVFVHPTLAGRIRLLGGPRIILAGPEVALQALVGRLEAQLLVETEGCRPRLVRGELYQVACALSGSVDRPLYQGLTDSVSSDSGRDSYPLDECSISP